MNGKAGAVTGFFAFACAAWIDEPEGGATAGFRFKRAKLNAYAIFFFTGGKSVHTPSATSAAIPIDSDSVGCG